MSFIIRLIEKGVFMLFELIFSILNLFVTAFFSLLPDFNLPSDFLSNVNAVAQYIGYLNVFVSLDLIVSIIALTIVRDNITFVKNILIGLWKLLPFT